MVLHIPRWKHNLLFVSKLIDVGVQEAFFDARCKMARGVRFGRLCKLEVETIECYTTYVKNESMYSLLEDVRVSALANGHCFWVSKGALSSKAKLLTKKTMLWH